ncbi:CAP domain-containing protein [Streptomyces sp. NPDC051133]|uniref:CAP domain-containing protein n=1 Tax=Streptomyces sp. NPDC051133 TaxID=3155521 RepID=UPI0034424D42
MRHVVRSAGAVAAAGVFALLTAGPSNAAAGVTPQQQPAATSVADYDPDIDAIVCEINKERDDHNLPALLISDTASDVARAHAGDMATMDKLTSIGSDGRDLRTRLSDAGIYSQYIEEFLFHGYASDGYFADMATDPEPSDGFYKVLMSSDVVALGLGYDDQYWDVNLLGPHRHLVVRTPSCSASTTTE